MNRYELTEILYKLFMIFVLIHVLIASKIYSHIKIDNKRIYKYRDQSEKFLDKMRRWTKKC